MFVLGHRRCGIYHLFMQAEEAMTPNKRSVEDAGLAVLFHAGCRSPGTSNSERSAQY